ncbi:MAG: hypothetical protein ACXVPC_09955 [Tumebacillaceae bacterium]
MKKAVFTALAVFALVLAFAPVQSHQSASAVVPNVIIDPGSY